VIIVVAVTVKHQTGFSVVPFSVAQFFTFFGFIWYFFFSLFVGLTHLGSKLPAEDGFQIPRTAS
jgi:hypothetical protein